MIRYLISLLFITFILTGATCKPKSDAGGNAAATAPAAKKSGAPKSQKGAPAALPADTKTPPGNTYQY